MFQRVCNKENDETTAAMYSKSLKFAVETAVNQISLIVNNTLPAIFLDISEFSLNDFH